MTQWTHFVEINDQIVGEFASQADARAHLRTLVSGVRTPVSGVWPRAAVISVTERYADRYRKELLNVEE